jgi:hypothetical protein
MRTSETTRKERARPKAPTLACLCIAALVSSGGCEQPMHKTPLPERPSRTPEQRRSHPVRTPGWVGGAGDGTVFFIENQRDRPEADDKRVVLVEEDSKRREVGYVFLSGPAVRGFVDLDVVLVATKTELTCYDRARHERRWVVTYEERSEIDDFVRRGDKLYVELEGGGRVTLDLETGRRSVP